MILLDKIGPVVARGIQCGVFAWCSCTLGVCIIKNCWCACTQERDVTRDRDASTLMREEDLVKPARIAGGSIKGLRVLRENGSRPDDGEPHWTNPCLWRHKSRSHALHHIVAITCVPTWPNSVSPFFHQWSMGIIGFFIEGYLRATTVPLFIK